MSGGVDSSAAALLLKDQGFDVIGVTMKLWDCFKTPSKKSCCSTADTVDAMRVCQQLNIPHHVLDMRESFRKVVVEYFVNEYSKGRTPNPCIKCNEFLKFDLMRAETLKLFETDFLATGHYARISDGRLFKGVDSSKDQSYFLFTLKKEQLNNTIFPLGDLKKEDVRKIAVGAGLKTAQKQESQEVCFIPDNDYAGFMADYYPELTKPAGNFVDKDGKVLGRHEGVHSYTIGQRRGLRFGFGKRRYVIGINVEKNEVVLGDNEDLMKTEMIVENVNWISPDFSSRATVKIRYRHEGSPAELIKIEDGRVKIVFETPQRAITPGQAAVFYDGDEVLGGGWIV